MRSDERVRSRLELDERARSARLCLEEASRERVIDRPHVTLREWLLAMMRHQIGRRDDSGSS